MSELKETDWDQLIDMIENEGVLVLSVLWEKPKSSRVCEFSPFGLASVWPAVSTNIQD